MGGNVLVFYLWLNFGLNIELVFFEPSNQNVLYGNELLGFIGAIYVMIGYTIGSAISIFRPLKGGLGAGGLHDGLVYGFVIGFIASLVCGFVAGLFFGFNESFFPGFLVGWGVGFVVGPILAIVMELQ
jgi:hypothetical protein